MNKKLFLMVMFIVIIPCFVTVNTVNAADVGYICSVNYVGSDHLGVGIYNVTCPDLDATSKWYTSSASASKTFLAIALTAVSLEKRVYIVIDSALGEWQAIKNLYLYTN